MFLIRKILGLVLTVMFTLTPHGGTLFADSPQEPKISGKTLRLGWYGEPAPLNPFQATDTIAVPILELIFNRLVRFGKDGNYEPDLAERWEVSDEGKTYTFYLRENVKFHDGVDCTAEDVAYTFQLLMSSETKPVISKKFAFINEVKALSDTIVEFKLKRPYAPFLLALTNFAHITPKHLLLNFEKDIQAFIQHPIGTGPFKLVGTEGADQIDLIRNDDYFEGRSAFTNLEMHLRENKRQIWAAFLRDEIDMITHLNRQDYEELEGHPTIHAYRALHITGYVLLLNIQNDITRDKQIRQAIALAIDSQSIMDDLEAGEGRILTGPYHPVSWGFNEDISPVPYRPQTALDLLRKAGFIKDESGVLIRDEKKFILWMIVDPKNEHLYEMAKLLRQQLQEIGIMVKFNFFDNYEELWKKADANENLFHLLLVRLNLTLDPDLASSYLSSSGIGNVGHFSHPEVDHLFELARENYDRNKRTAYYQKIHQIIAEEKPAVFLYVPYIYHATSARLKNTSALASPYFQIYMVKDFIVE